MWIKKKKKKKPLEFYLTDNNGKTWLKVNFRVLYDLLCRPIEDRPNSWIADSKYKKLIPWNYLQAGQRYNNYIKYLKYYRVKSCERIIRIRFRLALISNEISKITRLRTNN